MSFDTLGLSPELLRAISDAGYTTPTPIQEQAIPKVLEGRDVLGIAQTGTGKTASFVLPMIEVLSKGRAKARMPRTLILEPTRELAAQVAENFEKYGKQHKLTMALLIGGVSFGDQDALLTKGVDVLIATPGRLLDHFERGKLLLTGVQMLVVDEADRMLDMGFIPDIERIVKLTPFTRQTLFFSATMPPEITRLTEQFLSNPVRIEVSRPASAAPTITQRLVKCPSGDPKTKRTALRVVLESCAATIKNGIIFCNRKTEVDIVAKSLQKYGFDAAPIHGDLVQSQRTATLDRFRAGDLKLLVASDVAARGLDIPDVSHVFNFDVPRHADDYVHRIGRTGRAGRLGEAFMLVAPEDGKLLAAVQKLTGIEVPFAEIEGLPTSRVPDEFAGERRERKPRGRTSERGEDRTSARGTRRRQPAAEVDAAAPEAVEATPRAERPERAPRPERAERAERAPRAARPERAPERQAAEPIRISNAPQAAPRRRPDRPERGEAHVIAFGGDTPAFLLRPAPSLKELADA